MCCMILAALGAFSLGFNTAVHPAAIAPMSGPRESCRGKLNAPMINTAPRGSFLIFGLNAKFARSISSGFSSRMKRSKFLLMKSTSFNTQPTSAR
jgi:hypothetical protein